MSVLLADVTDFQTFVSILVNQDDDEFEGSADNFQNMGGRRNIPADDDEFGEFGTNEFGDHLTRVSSTALSSRSASHCV